ncbi:preprotein translocase subunit SecE [Thermoflexus sp.]|uniref:preprotein translocase subunit SecE n=1 Tax=Thermoflexus sp. TaxID=1969742 RepID=UPI0035E4071B
MAKAAETRRFLRSEWAPLRYLREVQGELKKVRWPDRRELYRLTGVVLAVTIGMSILLGLVDYFFFWLFGGIFTTPQDPLRLGIAIVGTLGGLGALVYALTRD